jgi:fibronectin-binding autotransporter adhesin
MAQQFIDFGSFPNDPAADPIRSAFQKIQNNFSDLYNTTLTSGVSELNVGPGLTQNRTTGNIYITTAFPNISINTSNSLLVGIGAATSNTATSSSYNTPFVLNLANTITTGNANLSGNVRTSNLNVANFVTSALVPSSNITYDLGTPTNRWKDLYLSGSTLYLGSQTIGSNATTITLTNVSVSSTITSTTINGGNITVTGNINSANITTANLLVTGNVTGNFVPAGNNQYDLGSSTQRWKDLWLSGTTLRLGGATISESAGAVVMESVVVTSNIDAGNVTAVYLDGTMTSTSQPLITSLGSLTNLSVIGDITSGNISVVGNVEADALAVASITIGTGATQTIITGGGVTVTGTATLQAPGANGEITFNDNGNAAAVPGLTFNRTSNLLSIAGNVSGGNLTTSGALSVTGNANVGNLGVTQVTASGNIIGANVFTVGIVSTSAGVSSGADLEITSVTYGINRFILNFATQDIIPFATGTTINVTGMSPTSYNGVWTVLTGTTSTAAVTSAITTTVVTLGRVRGGGNIVTNGFLTVIGNASVGNITTTRVDGTIVSVSGNVEGANLVASGVLRVDGNANVGNLTTSGFVSAATLATSASMAASTFITAGSYISATGNVSGANITTTGNVDTLNAFVSGTLTANILSATGTLSGGNLSTAGTLSAGTTTLGDTTTGNVTANYFSALGLSTSGALNAGTTTLGDTTTGNVTANILSAAALSTAGTLSAGNTSLGNITSVGLISATGKVTAGNLETGGTLRVNSVANLNSVETTAIALNGELTGATRMESQLLNVIGNMTSANANIGQFLTVVGNATIGNIVSNNSLVIQNTASIASSVNVGANLAISAISGTGAPTNLVTVTFTSQSTIPFPTGATVVISGVTTTTGYNGTYTAVSGNLTAVTYTSSTSGTGGVVSARIITGGLGLRVQGNATMSSLEILGATLNAQSATANFGTLNSNAMLINGIANAQSMEIQSTLSVTGTTTAGNLTANTNISAGGNISASGTITINQNATIGSSLTVGANLSLTAIAGTGSIVTANYSAQSFPPFPVGSNVIISGVATTAYNGEFVVTEANVGFVKYNDTTSSASGTLGRIRTGGTSLNIRGNASIINLEAASFQSNVATANFITMSSSGFLNLNGANANIGNANLTSANVTGDSSGGNLISRGYLAVSGNASMDRVTANAGITTAGAVNIGYNVQIQASGSSGNGTVATLAFSATQAIPPFPTGTTIIVSGLAPAGFNGTVTVASSNTTHVAYNNSTNGVVTQGGFARTSGTQMILQGVANIGSINTTGDISAGSTGNVSGNTFTATLFSGNGASITNLQAGSIVGQVANSLISTTVTGAAQSNITSVGSLSGLTLVGALTATDQDATFSKVLVSVQAGISASGTTLSGATALTKSINVVSSVNPGVNDSVRLPGATVGQQVIIINTTASTLKVFPANGSQIDGLGTNISFPLGAGARLMIVAATTTQWYTMVGVYG